MGMAGKNDRGPGRKGTGKRKGKGKKRKEDVAHEMRKAKEEGHQEAS